MKSDREWDQLIKTAPAIPFSGNLSRAVAQLSFDKSKKYLFTSTKRNRCNPDGVFCIYMGEDRDTAMAEYDKYYTDEDDHQPCVLYTGKFEAKGILDLGDSATVRHFGLKAADFYSAFRVNPNETPLEQLGRAVARQNVVCALRFPSDAMHVAKATGFNFVIFKQALVAPDSLRIVGPGGRVLDQWP